MKKLTLLAVRVLIALFVVILSVPTVSLACDPPPVQVCGDLGCTDVQLGAEFTPSVGLEIRVETNCDGLLQVRISGVSTTPDGKLVCYLSESRTTEDEDLKTTHVLSCNSGSVEYLLTDGTLRIELADCSFINSQFVPSTTKLKVGFRPNQNGGPQVNSRPLG